MNKEQLIIQGLEIKNISEISELCGKYQDWKNQVLRYAGQNASLLEQCRVQLHVVITPYESNEDTIKKYHQSIDHVIGCLQADKEQKLDALETIISNFGLYLHNMFCVVPENKATLQKDILEKIKINNEYDVQHMMYAVIKALYPSARREVNQDTGYGTVRYDIIISEIDTVIEIKCTRKDHSENKLYRELGEDAYFYQCSKLIIYVYDKQNIVQDANNFIKTLERTKETSGKDVRVYVEQMKELI